MPTLSRTTTETAQYVLAAATAALLQRYAKAGQAGHTAQVRTLGKQLAQLRAAQTELEQALGYTPEED